MTVYPAIDVRDGSVVRLYKGDYAQETRYSGDPVELARNYARAGAGWVHLVDLDAAREGCNGLLALVQQIRRVTPLRVQTGGGMRSAKDIEEALAAGADRIVVGSLAALDPPRVAAWLEEFGRERIVVALDVRRGDDGIARVPAHGWTATNAPPFDALLAFYREAGLQHLLCTVIERDGTLSGPDLNHYADIRRSAPEVTLQASGGIRDRDDIRATFAVGCEGVIVGKALLDARISPSEAFAW